MIYPAKTVQKFGACSIEFDDIREGGPESLILKDIVFAQVRVPPTFEKYGNDLKRNVTFVDEVTLIKNDVYQNPGMNASVRLGFEPYFVQLVTSLLEAAKDDVGDYGWDFKQVKNPFKDDSLVAFVKVPDHLVDVVKSFAGENEKLEAIIRTTFYYKPDTFVIGCALSLVKICPITVALQKILQARPVKPRPSPIDTSSRPPNGRRPLREIKPGKKSLNKNVLPDNLDIGVPYEEDEE